MVIKSVIERIKQKFNVSVSEVDAHDLWQRSIIGIALVANETQIINKVFEKIKNMLLEIHTIELVDSHMELL